MSIGLRKLGIACVAVMAMSQPVAADRGCADWAICGTVEVGADGLYITPVHCQYDYAALNPNRVTSVSTISCDADFGFRIFGSYRRDCMFIRAAYQWFETNDVDELVGEGVVARDNPTTFIRVKGNLNLHYQNADFRVGSGLYARPGCSLYFFGNARWIALSLRRRVRGVEENGDVDLITDKAELVGGAIGVGTGIAFDMWDNFGLFGEGGFLGVIADRKTPSSVFTDGDRRRVTPVTYRSKLGISPEAMMRAGLNYSFTCGRWTLAAEAGFEMDYFWKALSFARNVEDTSTASLSGWVRDCEDVGFAGLFFGLRLKG